MSDILIPSFGESITAATVAAWHKGAGDAVARGDTLVTLETDKVSTDLEADEDGMLEILVPEGAEAPIGAVLGRIAPSAGTSRSGKGRGHRASGTGKHPAAGRKKGGISSGGTPGTGARTVGNATGKAIRRAGTGRTPLHQETHEPPAPHHRGPAGTSPAPGGHPHHLQ